MWDKGIARKVELRVSRFQSMLKEAETKELVRAILADISSLMGDFEEDLNRWKSYISDYLAVLEKKLDIDEFLNKHGYISDYIEDADRKTKMRDLYEDFCENLTYMITEFSTFQKVLQDTTKRIELILYVLLARSKNRNK